MASDRAVLSKINRERTVRKNKAEFYHIGLGVLFFFLALFLFGCSAKEQALYRQSIKEVYIPVRCSIEMPVRPKQTGSTVKDNINIISYTKEVEQALKACIKGE